MAMTRRHKRAAVIAGVVAALTATAAGGWWAGWFGPHEDPRIAELLAGREIVKVVAVPGRLVNFVLRG